MIIMIIIIAKIMIKTRIMITLSIIANIILRITATKTINRAIITVITSNNSLSRLNPSFPFNKQDVRAREINKHGKIKNN